MELPLRVPELTEEERLDLVRAALSNPEAGNALKQTVALAINEKDNAKIERIQKYLHVCGYGLKYHVRPHRTWSGQYIVESEFFPLDIAGVDEFTNEPDIINSFVRNIYAI